MNNCIDTIPIYITGEGDPLLVIHGIISDADFFSNMIQFLKHDFKIVSYDRRGYGTDLTDWCGDYTVSSQADDAIAILEKIFHEPAWIFGNSAGGLIALEIALKRPDLVKGLILLEPSLNLDEDSIAMLGTWNAELNSYVKNKKIKNALVAFSRVVGNDGSMTSDLSFATLRRTYKNLENFMYGELNEIQKYYPTKEILSRIIVPVAVLITKQGQDSIFAVSSRNGAKIMGWPVQYISGYHNAVNESPKESALCIKEIIGKYNDAEK